MDEVYVFERLTCRYEGGWVVESIHEEEQDAYDALTVFKSIARQKFRSDLRDLGRTYVCVPRDYDGLRVIAYPFHRSTR